MIENKEKNSDQNKKPTNKIRINDSKIYETYLEDSETLFHSLLYYSLIKIKTVL